jgi:tetratricopeptide (TPR) repeat protein
MRKRHLCRGILALGLFLFLSPHPGSPTTLRLTVAPESKPVNSSKDPYNLWPRLRAMLRDQEGIEFVTADSVSKMTGDEWSADFYREFEPVSLYEANRSLRLDAALFFGAEMTKDTLHVYLTIKEVPTGSTLSSTKASLPQKQAVPLQNQILKTHLNQVLLDAIDIRQTHGFAFSDEDNSMLVMVHPMADSAYRETIVRYLGELDLNADEPVMVRIEESGVPVKFCSEAINQTTRLHARFVLAMPAADGNGYKPPSLFIAPDSLPEAIIRWPVPLVFSSEALLCVSAPMDSMGIGLLNAALFQKRERGFARLRQENLLQNHRSFVDQHLALFYHFAVQAERQLQAMPADSMRWLVELYQHMVTVPQAMQDRAWLWLNFAGLQDRLQNTSQALVCYRTADSLFQKAGEKKGAAVSRLQLGNLLSKLKDYEASRKEYSRAVDMLATIPDSLSMVEAMHKIAQLYELDNKPGEARSAYMKTAEVYDRLHYAYESSRIYEHLGKQSREKADFGDALRQFDAYLVSANEMHNEPAMARGHFQLGMVCMQTNAWDTALEHFTKAMDLFEILGDSVGMSRADMNIGTIKRQKGELDQAKSHYLSALSIAEARHDSSSILLANMNLAELSTIGRAWGDVQTHYDQALATAQLLNNVKEQANILYAKGLAHLKEGRLKTGYNELQQAIELAGGTVSGDAEKEQAFLRKLETIIGDIHNIRGSSEP